VSKLKTQPAFASRVAKQGEKMIEVRIRFWTDEIASEKGKILPKHAWSYGVVHVQRNESHEISPENPRPFNSLLDIGSVIEKVLIEHGIVLHVGGKMKKYVSN
jgi:hypothetical protein